MTNTFYKSYNGEDFYLMEASNFSLSIISSIFPFRFERILSNFLKRRSEK